MVGKLRGELCLVALAFVLAAPATARDAVVTYVDPGLYPARIGALNFAAWMDGQVATPQRLEAGHPITVKSWGVALKTNRMAEFILRNRYGARQSWAVRVRAACTASGEAAPSGCALTLARKGGIPDCALMVSDPLAGKRKKIVIECPQSVEFADVKS